MIVEDSKLIDDNTKDTNGSRARDKGGSGKLEGERICCIIIEFGDLLTSTCACDLFMTDVNPCTKGFKTVL